ncbi:hypothetical protein LB505_005118 [Fusarium chuoi]|nr:hypothetical protein LB505_005118 [Fusarium chuoi]
MKKQKEALSLDPGVKVDGVSIRDDEDANNRQHCNVASLLSWCERRPSSTCAMRPRVTGMLTTPHLRRWIWI